MSAAIIIGAIGGAIGLVEQLLPVAAGLGPLISKAISGSQLNDADLAQLDAITQGLNAEVEAAEQGVLDQGAV